MVVDTNTTLENTAGKYFVATVMQRARNSLFPQMNYITNFSFQHVFRVYRRVVVKKDIGVCTVKLNVDETTLSFRVLYFR